MSTTLSGYLDGSRSLPDDLREVLARPRLDSEAIQQLTLSALMGRMMLGADKGTKEKIVSLLEKAKELGVDTLGLG